MKGLLFVFVYFTGLPWETGTMWQLKTYPDQAECVRAVTANRAVIGLPLDPDDCARDSKNYQVMMDQKTASYIHANIRSMRWPKGEQ